jgi:SnoaL-like protein
MPVFYSRLRGSTATPREGDESMDRQNQQLNRQNQTDLIAAAERVYKAWDEALGAKDLDAALALYDTDAVIESPLVVQLLGIERGICQGHDQLRRFIGLVFRRLPAERKRYRTGFFTDGATLMWEYPRAAPAGEQMDFVEVMELNNGLIHRHRVYWGWYGLSILTRNQH